MEEKADKTFPEKGTDTAQQDVQVNEENVSEAAAQEDNGTGSNPLRSAFLVLAGGYLLYLAFGLRRAVTGMQGFERVIIIAAMIVFVLTGGFLVIKNIRAVLDSRS